MKNVKLTQASLDAFLRALKRALQDPEVSEAMTEIGPETVFDLAHGVDNEESAVRLIKNYFLNEMSRRRADQKDLGFRHFTEDELALLRFAPQGKALLTRMRDADEAAVAQAKSLLKEIKRVREGLGLL